MILPCYSKLLSQFWRTVLGSGLPRIRETWSCWSRFSKGSLKWLRDRITLQREAVRHKIVQPRGEKAQEVPYQYQESSDEESKGDGAKILSVVPSEKPKGRNFYYKRRKSYSSNILKHCSRFSSLTVLKTWLRIIQWGGLKCTFNGQLKVQAPAMSWDILD